MPYVPSNELHCNYIMIAILSILIGMYLGQPRPSDPCKAGYRLDALKTLESNPSLASIINSPQPPVGVEYKGPDSFSLVCARAPFDDEEY